MPTIKVKTKTTGAKSAPKAAPKATAKSKPAAKATASNGSSRERIDYDGMVKQFVAHLKGGGTMRALKEELGVSSDVGIREALARAGYDSKGQALELPNVAGTPKGVAAARKQGHAWYIIALATGKTEAEVKELAEKGGADVSGRVRVGGGRGR